MRYASLSLDLDNLWSYLKIHGDAAWREYPSYLDRFVERFTAFCEERRLKMTVFVVGQDAAQRGNRDALQTLARRHEIGNHSFYHEPWIARAPRAKAEEELVRAHQAIAEATDCEPVGFRGPGFATSSALLEALAANNYRYDASHLPTFVGPLARAWYFRGAKLSNEEREARRDLFGAFSDVFRRNKAHVTSNGIVEIPVTTMPLLRVPVHCSYLHFLDAISPQLADAYWRTSLALCDLTATHPSLLLHPLDFMGVDDAPELAFFPAMQRTTQAKLAATGRFIDEYLRRYNVLTMREHADMVDAPAFAVETVR